jgi:hypothetical protein
MNIQSEIDDTLRRLGSVEPPSGLAKRVNLRLQNQPSRFSFSILNTRIIAACALAASVGLSAVALNPGLRNMVFHHHHTSAQSTPPANTLRVVPPAAGGFGTASTIHVPAEPVPVQPSPVNQGRGRSRSGRAVLPNGSQTPLPRGVVAPTAPLR